MSTVHRVRHYQASTYYSSTGSSGHGKFAFLPEHFQEAGVPLHPDGMPYEAAQALCAKWSNPKRQSRSIRHSCSLLTEDWLRVWDARRAEAQAQALAG